MIIMTPMMIDYTPSYNKYGGYNGYDDQTIDDVFGGDPSATWNID